MNCPYKKLFRVAYIVLFLASLWLVVNVFPSFIFSSKSLLVEKEVPAQVDFHHLNRENNDRVIASLKHQIEDLKNLMKIKTQQLEAVQKLKVEVDSGGSFELPDVLKGVFADGDLIVHYITEQQKKAESLKGTITKGEYDMNPFSMFDKHFFYQLDMRLIARPRDIIASRRDLSKELAEVISQGVRSLNEGSDRLKVSPTYRFTDNDFMYGLVRTERAIGTHYELAYKPQSSPNIPNKSQLFRLTFFRPFAPLNFISSSSVNTSETIHFVVPLQERTDTFKIFIEFFKDFAVPDGNIHLTVIYYGLQAVIEVEQILQSLYMDSGFQKYRLIKITGEEFSRGRALQHGVDSITGSNPLLFFCDVDIAFTREFLNQCRTHAVTGKSVFYPIVFSLFNPLLTYKNAAVPSLRNRQKMDRHHGLWRDFGFGMSCQYLSDFTAAGGYNLNVNGWGTEDTLLYRKFATSNTIVIRTPVDSLFHHWHEKHCDKTLSADQYLSCLKSKSRTEGSQVQLGLEYFQLKEKLLSLDKT